MSEGTRSVEVVRIGNGPTETATDHVAVEAALEVRLNGHPFAVIMRTPGADADLVGGFLLSEGVIRSADDVHRLDGPDTDGVLNVILSRSRAEILPDLLEGRRNVTQNSSCGMCGRRTLESLEIDRPPLAVEWHLDTTVLAGLPAALRRAQHAFDETGGLHAAGLFDLDGRLLWMAEDVGRHNAVDKITGRMLLEGKLPLSRALLQVSGRTSFELVQKALLAGIPLIAAVSAPSSLAIDLAREAGITLCGFVRGEAFNVYAHPERITSIDR
jgi:FdhD protein